MTQDVIMFKNKTILVAEDDLISCHTMVAVLEMLFDKVHSTDNGREAYEIYESESPDIILTDIKMPHMDGITLARKIRREDYNIPIILLTGFAELEFAISAANLSVDGYLIKPTGFEQLTATLRKAIQRVSSPPELVMLGNHLYYNTATHELYHHRTLITLGKQEGKLLRFFIVNRHRTLSKDEIKKKLWPIDSQTGSSLKNMIFHLRKKLGKEIIVSVPRVGYRLKTHNEREEAQ
jgi:two-component system, OmpR family, response regulator VanR